jgi:hypothetical protein
MTIGVLCYGAGSDQPTDCGTVLMYEFRHFSEDDCERLPTSLQVKPELLFDAHDDFEHMCFYEVSIGRTRWVTTCHRQVPW